MGFYTMTIDDGIVRASDTKTMCRDHAHAREVAIRAAFQIGSAALIGDGQRMLICNVRSHDNDYREQLAVSVSVMSMPPNDPIA